MFPVRLLAVTGAAAAASFSAVSAVAAPTTGELRAPHPQRVSIVIQAGDRVPAPNVALAPGVPVRLTVVNFTREFHTFTIAGLKVSALIRPAVGQTPSTTIVAFTPHASGVYTWHCVICPSGAHGRRHAMGGDGYVIVGPSALP